MKIIYLILFTGPFLLNSLTATSQERRLSMNYVRNSNNSIDFKFEKSDPGTYTVKLTITDITNSSSFPNKEYSAKGYTGTLFTLHPKAGEQAPGFRSYSYTYIRGKLNPKYDPDFVYVLPVAEGVDVKAMEIGFIGSQYFGNTTPDDWKYYRFFTKGEGKVLAMRKGMVVEVVNGHSTDNARDLIYTNKQNEVIVEHADGSLMSYKGFKYASIAVKEGEVVYPGTFLGINVPDPYDRFNIAVVLMYLRSSDTETYRKQNLSTQKSLYGFITPKFTIGKGQIQVLEHNKDYVGHLPASVVQLEMTKKEVREMGAN